MKKLYFNLFAGFLLVALFQNNTLAQCTTEAGTMEFNPITTCEGNSVTATHQGDENLDGDDVLQYVLHDNPGTTLGAVFAIDNGAVFTFKNKFFIFSSFLVHCISYRNFKSEKKTDARASPRTRGGLKFLGVDKKKS